MFSSFTSRLRSEINTLKLVLDTHDSLRGLIFSRIESAQNTETPESSSGEEKPSPPQTGSADPLASIRASVPSKPSWQVYDHCAAFTRLYAVYEQFVDELISDYLRLLPSLYPQYGGLPTSVTKQHRVGVGQILLKLGKDGPYRDFEERQIVEGLSQGLLGNANYTLLPAAFLIDPQNYRADAVAKLFSYLGFEDCWPWVERHALMTAFMQKRDANETPKTLLHDFVEYRNKASHTVVGDIVATDEIKSIADFVIVLSEVLAQLLMKQVVERMKSTGQTTDVGSVVHKFSSNIIGATMRAGELAVGDELIVVQKHACFKARVLSIQIHDAAHENLVLSENQEIGIRLSETVNEGARLMKFSSVASAQVAPPGEAVPEAAPAEGESQDGSEATLQDAEAAASAEEEPD